LDALWKQIDWGAGVKIVLVLLAAYAIVGAFHSYREFYRGRKYFPESQHRHRWLMSGLTWLPASIVFPLMSPASQMRWQCISRQMRGKTTNWVTQIWRRENLKDSAISWLLFALVVGVGIGILS
jgi:hypothetical protein